MIEDARLQGLDEKDGRELEDLEIFAELQHHGAATCLIDFTYSAQVAHLVCIANRTSKPLKIVIPRMVK